MRVQIQRHVPILAIAIVTLGGACHEDSPCDPPRVRPLFEFCNAWRRTCEGYQQAIGQAQAAHQVRECLIGRAGTCGNLSYVQFNSRDSGYVAYYDRTGAIVAATTNSDLVFVSECGVVPDPVFGREVDCTKVPDVDLCPRSS